MPSCARAFVFSAILLQRHGQAQERLVETLIVGTSRSIVQAVEREITANITTLRVLATTPALEAGDYRSFHARVRSALQGTGTYVYLLDSELMTVMNTRVPCCFPPARDGSFIRDRSTDAGTGIMSAGMDAASNAICFLVTVRPNLRA